MKITVIGAGRVGTHLARKLYRTGHQIVQVFSRDPSHAKMLAMETGAAGISDLAELSNGADFYILAVPDHAIGSVAAALADLDFGGQLIAHTSGATPMSVLASHQLNRCGVFYPLQTFTLDREPDFSQIPICIHASRREDLVLLKSLASQLTTKVFDLDDEQRSVLHVAAVFSNNFSNQLFQIAYQLLQDVQLPFDLLLPLIRETVAKLDSGPPANMQTGPAVRGDHDTIQRHLHYLEANPDLRAIYEMLSNHISKTHNT